MSYLRFSNAFSLWIYYTFLTKLELSGDSKIVLGQAFKRITKVAKNGTFSINLWWQGKGSEKKLIYNNNFTKHWNLPNFCKNEWERAEEAQCFTTNCLKGEGAFWTLRGFLSLQDTELIFFCIILILYNKKSLQV